MTKQLLNHYYKLLKGKVQPEYENELSELETSVKEFIDSIPDDYVRAAMSYHYITGLTWEQVADYFNCTSSDAVQKRCTRYINKHEKDH